MESAATMEFLPAVAAPGVSRDFLVVSIHDVAPSSRELVDEMITTLGHRGVRVCSLLVVPDYHHQGLFTKDRQFVSWLRDLEVDGHEAVIHGYFHERPRRPEESLRDKFLTRFYTHHEGEFYDLDYAEALQRITNARDEFRRLGWRRAALSHPPGCSARQPSALRVTPNWNTPRGCTQYAICVREKNSPRDRLFIASEPVGDVRPAVLGMPRSSGFCRAVRSCA